MTRYLLPLILFFTACAPTPTPRFHAGDSVEVKVDHRKGVIIDLWNEYTPSYRVRLHSHIIGYRVIVMHEEELQPSRP